MLLNICVGTTYYILLQYKILLGFFFLNWKCDYGRMVRDTIFLTLKLEEGAMSQECRQYLKAGKDKEMESLLESPKRTQPVISVLHF